VPAIYVSPLRILPEAFTETRASHVISLLGPGYMHLCERPDGLDPDRHLRVHVNDIVEPLPDQVVPAEDHVEQVLSFAGRWDRANPILIHCWAGISRSTAAAYMTLCQINGRGSEHALARMIRRRAPHARPNRLLVALADKALGRDGAMVEAVDAMGPAQQVDIGVLFKLPLAPETESARP